MNPRALADVNRFARYLADASTAASILSESETLLLVLEAVTDRCERYLGGRTFGPVLETKTWPAYLRPFSSYVGGVTGPQGFNQTGASSGTIAGRAGTNGLSDLDLARTGRWSDWIWPDGMTGGAELALNAWILAASSVTLVSGDGRTTKTLTAGPLADYEILPSPAGARFRLTQAGAGAIVGGAWTLQITGTWGYQDTRRPLTTLGADATDSAADLTFAGADLAQIAAGMTLWIDAEQVYVQETPQVTTPVLRGVNGTVAAAHSTNAPVSLVTYPADVVWTALEIARSRWRNRNMGPGNTVGQGDQGIAVGSVREDQYLKRLDSLIEREHEGAPQFGVA